MTRSRTPLSVAILLCSALAGACGGTDPYAHFAAGDYHASFKAFRRLADSGDVAAGNFVGIHYYLGAGVARDYATAAQWFERAALAGNARLGRGEEQRACLRLALSRALPGQSAGPGLPRDDRAPDHAEPDDERATLGRAAHAGRRTDAAVNGDPSPCRQPPGAVQLAPAGVERRKYAAARCRHATMISTGKTEEAMQPCAE
jgi:hypothetical protein